LGLLSSIGLRVGCGFRLCLGASVIFWAGVQASVAVDFLGGSRWHGLPFLGWNYHGSMGAKSYLAIHSSALYVFFFPLDLLG